MERKSQFSGTSAVFPAEAVDTWGERARNNRMERAKPAAEASKIFILNLIRGLRFLSVTSIVLRLGLFNLYASLRADIF